MDMTSIIIGLTNIGVGLLLVGLLVPLLYDKIPRNHWYGFRFPSSMTDDEAWYAVNRYGARQMIIWSVALIAFGCICLLIPVNNNPLSAVIGGSASVIVLIPAFQTWRFARNWQRQR